MRFVSLCFMALTLAACASTPSAPPFPDAQEVVDEIASRHPELTRLTLHAVPANASKLTQVASTAPERRGKLSDVEDIAAMQTGGVVVLDEPGAIDVTVPILQQSGKPSAIAGVTLKSTAAEDRQAVVRRAEAIARELETAIRGAARPLW